MSQLPMRVLAVYAVRDDAVTVAVAAVECGRWAVGCAAGLSQPEWLLQCGLSEPQLLRLRERVGSQRAEHAPPCCTLRLPRCLHPRDVTHQCLTQRRAAPAAAAAASRPSTIP
jgi:hypothetical protein